MNIENIPGFEETPEIKLTKDVQIICKMANIKLTATNEDFFSNGEAIKKLLDDRRELIKLCLTMYPLLFYGYTNPPTIDETNVCKVLEEATGKKIDELYLHRKEDL